MQRLLLALVLLLAAGCGSSDDIDAARYGEKPDYGAKPGAATAPAASGGGSAVDGAFTADDLVGTWRVSAFIPADEIERLSDDPIPAGTEVEATIEGEIAYLASGEYDGAIDIVYRVRANGQEIPLRFRIDSQGTWEVDGNLLREVTVDETFSPGDALTAEAVRDDPSFGEDLTSASGEVSETRVLSHSASSIELEEVVSGLQLALRR